MKNDSMEGKTTVISGSGNVAIYACEKAQSLGAKVVAMSDSNGYVYDPDGIKLDVVKQIKEVERGRISEYAKRVSGSEYHEGCNNIWTIKCDVALPCATQNEIDGNSAEILVKNGVIAVAEGANMPSTPEAVEIFKKREYCSARKGGKRRRVATSGLEMSQNSMRLSWSAEEVDAKGIMETFSSAYNASAEYGHAGSGVRRKYRRLYQSRGINARSR